MPNMSPSALHLPAVAVLLGCALLAGCEARTDVSATGNAPAQFTHVYLTVNQIWFNSSGSAGPSDSSWQKFTLTTPQTVDLANLTNGALTQIASNLTLTAGNYAQIMLVLADSTDALTASAQNAGAASNDEVDYVDALNVAHAVPLAVLNAAQGISIATSLTVAASSSTLGGDTSTTSSSTTNTDTSSDASIIGTATTTTGTTSTTTATPGVTISTFIIDFDATRDLVPISLSGQAAYLLNPHPQAYDAKYSGTIAGAVDLSAVSTLTTAELPDVQVAAESLSADGTRHVITLATRVGTDGTFSLYPLSTASGAPTSYDLVIHGPTIDTVIIKAVPVTNAAPGAASALLGTIELATAAPFLVNVNSSAPVAPSGSLVGFYQTLPLSSEVPYLVETRAVDPTSGRFATDQALSAGSVQYGTYVAGGTIALTTTNPTQGGSSYAIAAINPAYGTAALGTTVTAPASSTITALFTVGAPAVPSGATADAITGTVSVAGGNFDNAVLFLTQRGALVSAASLNGNLSGQSSLTLNAIAPGGSSSAGYAAGVYNAEVWAWNSGNPTGTLTRIPYATSIDMSAGNASVALTIP